MKGATRLSGFDKPTVWTVMTPLAVKTESVNLGQGFPSWNPPQFYLDYLHQTLNSNPSHQYIRAFGSPNYTQAISEFHKRNFGNFPHLCKQQCITTVFGGVEGLFCSIMGNVNQGDEVCQFDPSYDCYRPQVQMAGGKVIGIPLKPKMTHSREHLLERFSGKEIFANDEDQWEIDFDLVEKTLNEKTKIFILNSPHNPTGKVFTNEQLSRLAKILQKYPQVIAVEDNVYEGMTFDDMFDKPLPKLAFQEGMEDRTISVYSAGKIFSCTGVRSGWVIASPALSKTVRSVHQVNTFCSYSLLETTFAKCVERITRPGDTYLNDCAKKLTHNRDVLIQELLLKCKFDLDFWVPKGGYFIMADISRVNVDEKYMKDEEGTPRTKDWAFAYQLANENKVVCIPMSPFYDKSQAQLGARYVRFAFCKTEEMIREAAKRMK